jgi:uncharacterized protein (TIGR03032 family)
MSGCAATRARAPIHWRRGGSGGQRAREATRGGSRDRSQLQLHWTDGYTLRRMANTEAQPFSLDDLKFDSLHTDTFPPILRELGISLVVSAIRISKLAVLRASSSGGPLNAHYRMMRKPMGIALAGDRMAVSGHTQIYEFRRNPMAVARADIESPPGPHDCCYLPTCVRFTSNIYAHDIAYAGPNLDELWIVNTTHSCLCTLSDKYSFEPRWQPPFITELMPEDRCHLNGLTTRDGQPRYVTIVGTGNHVHSWRNSIASGGVVMDITNNEIISRGYCMPHSPRWHEGRLWVLNSGAGEFGYIDLANGKFINLATLPGFTRGLDFYGPYAFVGTSQIRDMETDLPLNKVPKAERLCGVWIVEYKTGRVAGYLKFIQRANYVPEVFDVRVLANTRWPEVVTDDLVLPGVPFLPPQCPPVMPPLDEEEKKAQKELELAAIAAARQRSTSAARNS